MRRVPQARGRFAEEEVATTAAVTVTLHGVGGAVAWSFGVGAAVGFDVGSGTTHTTSISIRSDSSTHTAAPQRSALTAPTNALLTRTSRHSARRSADASRAL